MEKRNSPAQSLLSLLDLPVYCHLIAPPGWGKTQMILQWAQERGVVFLSPLRAIVQELLVRAQSTGKVNAHLISNRQHGKVVAPTCFASKRPFLLMATVETFPFELLEQAPRLICVLDEIHLFYQWGEEFRPLLWQRLLDLMVSQHGLLGLSATWGQRWHAEWQRDFSQEGKALIMVDLGNFTWLNPPTCIWQLPAPLFSWYTKIVMLWGNGGVLLFCQYRQQVDQWLRYCQRWGISALGVKGGESAQFYQALAARNNQVQVIIATSVLSHGVNLPSVRWIIINHRLADLAFWVQMVARGGRRGEKYLVVQPWVRKRASAREKKYGDNGARSLQSRGIITIQDALSRSASAWQNFVKKWKKN